MSKYAPDNTLDTMLDYIALSTKMIVCSTQPTTYTEAATTYNLAEVTVAPADFTKANDTSGRKVTIAAKSGVSITSSATALHVALVTTTGSILKYVTTCTSQALVSGGTVDIPSWKINIQDPT